MLVYVDRRGEGTRNAVTKKIQERDVNNADCDRHRVLLRRNARTISEYFRVLFFLF